LLFSPANFSAGSVGGGIDETKAQLQVPLTARNPGGTLDAVRIDEFGHLALEPGMPELIGTGVFVHLSGSLTVIETLSGPIAPLSLNFTNDFGRGDDPPQTLEELWSLSTLIDIESCPLAAVAPAQARGAGRPH
jgi:hypothetical protein